MKDLLEVSCGLDVHKEKIVACILSGPLGGKTISEIREFTTLSSDLIALRDWIVENNCYHVAMESTGVYWIPVYETLETVEDPDRAVPTASVAEDPDMAVQAALAAADLPMTLPVCLTARFLTQQIPKPAILLLTKQYKTKS